MTVDVVRVTTPNATSIRLLESAEVRNGERYLRLVHRQPAIVEDICADIDRLLPELRFDIPNVVDPFPERIQAREAEFRAIWALGDLRNDRIRAVTGVSFRPLDESIRDCVESLLSVAKVRPRVRVKAVV